MKDHEAIDMKIMKPLIVFLEKKQFGVFTSFYFRADLDLLHICEHYGDHLHS